MRTLSVFSKHLSNTEDNMSSRIFTTMAMDDVYSITIVQQCKMLEAPLSMNITIQCFQCPSESAAIVHSSKTLLDYDLPLSSALTHPSVVEPIARITSVVSWRRIWDGALDYGAKGTTYVQAILRELSRPTFGDHLCHICSEQITGFSTHLCTCHPSLACIESLCDIISKSSSSCSCQWEATWF